jgi:hypothetical protein
MIFTEKKGPQSPYFREKKTKIAIFRQWVLACVTTSLNPGDPVKIPMRWGPEMRPGIRVCYGFGIRWRIQGAEDLGWDLVLGFLMASRSGEDSKWEGPGMTPGIRVSYGFGIRFRTWKFRVWGAVVVQLGFFFGRLLLPLPPQGLSLSQLSPRQPGPEQ